MLLRCWHVLCGCSSDMDVILRILESRPLKSFEACSFFSA